MRLIIFLDIFETQEVIGMLRNIIFSIVILFLIVFPIFGEDPSWEDLGIEGGVVNLYRDLETARKIDKWLKYELPVIRNYLMQGGYFAMPSARMPKDGDLAFGFAYLPPYRLWSLTFQFFGRVEMGGNYWIFHGIQDYNLGKSGFGDEANRAGNIKVALLKKEDGFPFLPEISLGINDFIGSRQFHSFYAVATKQFLDYDFEFTLGYGTGRIKGLFSALAWSPWHKKEKFYKDISFILEYDANNYKYHFSEHAKGRKVKCPINGGVSVSLFDKIRFSVSSIRGDAVAASLALSYNLGQSEGIFEKFGNQATYSSPVDLEPLCGGREEAEFAQNLTYAFKAQGFDLYSLYLEDGKPGKELYIKVVNLNYRKIGDLRSRIESILLGLMPSDVETVRVAIDADGILCQELKYLSADLKRYREKKIGTKEFEIVSPLKNAGRVPTSYDAMLLYERHRKIWTATFRPAFRSYFGSSTGKFKYDVGVIGGPEGYLYNDIYYMLEASYTIKSSSAGVGDRDLLNPSQIWNVRSDTIRYYQSNTFHIETAYLQKSFNLTSGVFTRFALGYFEIAYMGAAGEILFYPVYSNWAIGFEVAYLLKRKYSGLWVTHTLRKFKGDVAVYGHINGLWQYFFDFYYTYRPLDVGLKVSVGQFLARDLGIKLELIREFTSGLRVSFWYTFTDGGDRVNNKRYYDKGFSFSIPLDIFLHKSSKTRLSYGMSAWLRDVGCKAATGKELFPVIYDERSRY